MLKKEQIEYLKKQLVEKKEQLLKEANSSQTIIKELLSESSYDELDYAEVSSDSFNLNILRERQLRDLQEIDLSLRKIQNNTYGICEMCDGPIGIKRLKVKPHARFCIECREFFEKQEESKRF
jgi:DnaK suppressor protein